MSQPVQFEAEIVKVQTIASGGARVTLDLPEYALGEAAALMALTGDTLVRVTVEVVSDGAARVQRGD
jgi:hypothetical protein